MYARVGVQSRKSSLNAAVMLRCISPRLLQFSISCSTKRKKKRFVIRVTRVTTIRSACSSPAPTRVVKVVTLKVPCTLVAAQRRL